MKITYKNIINILLKKSLKNGYISNKKIYFLKKLSKIFEKPKNSKQFF